MSPPGGPPAPSGTLRVGVISDTHGLLRPEALDALGDSELILHAGDVGSPEILPALRRIAPVVVVRGNVDTERWADDWPTTEAAQAGGLVFYMIHDLEALDLDPAAAGMAAVISGHSHRPSVKTSGGVLFLNPGSAGPRRFKLPVTVARLDVIDGAVSARLIELKV